MFGLLIKVFIERQFCFTFATKCRSMWFLTTANFRGFSNFCRYYTRSQTGKSTGYRPTLNPLSSHLEWRAGLSDTILKRTHPGTIPARFGLIWFSGFRGEDLNVIFNQNMHNLHNRYISAERKISQKNPECMLIYSLPCSCS